MKDEPERIARALGGAERTGQGWFAYCPCHENSRTPALSLGSGTDGRLLAFCHAGCGGIEVLAELARRGLIEGRAGPAPVLDLAQVALRKTKADASEKKRQAAAERLWQSARPASGTIAEAYLGWRGIKLAMMPAALRFVESAMHPTGKQGPAMIARILDAEGKMIGCHRTWLRRDGQGKAELSPSRAMLGRSAGGAVRFGPNAPVLVLSEGIETALSVGQAARLTVWSCLSTGGLRPVRLPSSEVAGSVVIIAADHDEAGLAAAWAAADRLEGEGRAVSIVYPPTAGADFNDILVGQK